MKKTTITEPDDPSFKEEPKNLKQQESQWIKKRRLKKSQQPARPSNIEALVHFFESGITEDKGKVGIELEHTIVEGPDALPVSYSQDHGILWVLEQLKREYPAATFDTEGDLLGVARPFEAVTIEPAAQLELSAGPFSKLGEASGCFESFEAHLDKLLSPFGKQTVLVGYHPSARACDLELIPKRRYKIMNFYLSEIGSFGPCMMRGSASTQVSIDYDSVEDCLRKLRLAYALVPLFSLICDNSPVFEGEPRKHELVRTEIWQKCDPDRCGLVPGVMDKDFSLRDYAEYILDTPAILVPCKNHEWCYTDKTFGEIYRDTTMDQKAVEHAISMFFNDVRLKTYLEIRPADAMPIPYVIAYAALIKGLFYSEENLDTLDGLFEGVRAHDVNLAKENLMKDGYQASVYGKPVAELADAIMFLAGKGLCEEECGYLEPLAELVAKRVTLADLT